MTDQQYSIATDIRKEIASIECEIRRFENNLREEVRHPIAFRMGGIAIENVPKHVIDNFREASVTELNKRLEELRRDFDQL